MIYLIAIALSIHAIVHLMGFASYWQLANIEGLSFNDDVGKRGVRFFGLLWVITFIGYSIAIYGCLMDSTWWQPALYFSTVLSLIITVMDWEVAYIGAVINAVILIVLIF